MKKKSAGTRYIQLTPKFKMRKGRQRRGLASVTEELVLAIFLLSTTL
jgi:hypothetical protein